jgi:ketosteroid isomerase-like protein
MSRPKTAVSALAAMLAFTLAGCAGSGDAPVAEEPKIDLVAEEEAVRSLNAQWLEHHRARNAEGIGALFVADGWSLSATEGLAEGTAAIVARGEEDFAENPDAVGDWGAKQVWVSASGDMAIERGWWMNDEDGDGEKEGINGEYLTVFTKVGGEWKILADAAIPLEATDDDD